MTVFERTDYSNLYRSYGCDILSSFFNTIAYVRTQIEIYERKPFAASIFY